MQLFHAIPIWLVVRGTLLNRLRAVQQELIQSLNYRELGQIDTESKSIVDLRHKTDIGQTELIAHGVLARQVTQ